MFVLGCCCCSVAQLCLTLCDSMDCRTPAFSVLHYLPEEFDQTHVHWASDAIQPTHPLSSPFPPAFSLSLHQGLFQWVGSLHQVAKVLEVQLQHQSFHEYSWLISFRIDWFALLASQESSPTHSSNTSILQHSAFFMIQLSHPCMITGKTKALTIRTFVSKVMSLHFYMPSMFVLGWLVVTLRLISL